MTKLSDLSISGMGKVNGGTFGNVDISGLGTIQGDVEAERIIISGKGTIEGNTKAAQKIDISGMGRITGNVEGKEITSSGTGTIEGNLQGERIQTSGNLKIGGNAKVVELATDGRSRIDGQLKAEKIMFHGYLSVGADVEAEEFISQGSFSIDGLLNANRIDIDINGFCKVNEIGGEEILVRNRHGNWNFLTKFVNSFLGNDRELGKLSVKLIEGTDIYLEYSHVGIVRGNNIKIGPQCTIEEVEYRDSLSIDPSSTVKRETKM
ncbi:polymer-forming cytoskeletal protein [Desulfosporosinus sp. PR]|uniref:polymer-forming cytoskeletal protein n=1 Tax=Candidatus Desulfosporosinus nitrosoreducens TaxID=3401928 RepID=UPI0027E905C8|nr:polymer-forming cytoskeletal protein [Desulfosporosinus sp. PR]MDQ7092149.1 polymer-forming cytoskeletal protein [Desulfosporosinus sp. PR]